MQPLKQLVTIASWLWNKKISRSTYFTLPCFKSLTFKCMKAFTKGTQRVQCRERSYWELLSKVTCNILEFRRFIRLKVIIRMILTFLIKVEFIHSQLCLSNMQNNLIESWSILFQIWWQANRASDSHLSI